MAIPKKVSTSGALNSPQSEEDTFEPLSLDEQLAHESEEDNEQDSSGEDAFPEEPAEPSKPTSPPRDSKPSARSNERKLGEQPIEIDPKRKMLKKFGSGSKKGVLRTQNFEPRKNLRFQQTVARLSVLAIMAGILVVAAYQAVFPAKPLTPQEVQTIALEATNYSNFPVESARGFATDFMKAYLTVDPNSPAQSVLGYYQSGALGEGGGASGNSGSNSTRTATGSYNQTLLYGPTVYSARGLTDSSGSYTIGALVQPKEISNSNTSDSGAEAAEAAPRWMFFNVNVYYDDETQAFAITPDSPSVIPATEVKSPDDLPDPFPLGTGEPSDELKADVSSVVNGYIQGYMSSSPSDHSALDQYVVRDPEPSLVKGLNGEYSLDDSANAITYEAFPVEESNEVKVRVKVVWTASPDGSAESESKVQFTSSYVMTLLRQSDGRYLVAKFAPEYYVPDTTE